jgi:hypothetical protein
MLLDTPAKLLCFIPEFVITDRLIRLEVLVDFGNERQNSFYVFLRLAAAKHFR